MDKDYKCKYYDIKKVDCCTVKECCVDVCLSDLTADRDRLQVEVDRLKEKESLSESMMDAMTRLIDKQAEEIKAMTARCKAAEELLDDTFNSPHSIDGATVPLGGLEYRPEQVVMQYSISYTKYKRWITLKNKEAQDA